MKFRLNFSLSVLTLALGLTLAPSALAQPVTFSAGSLVIPMDTGTGVDDGQDNDMLRAYGLVYALLRNNVPVHWVINPVKAANGADFMLSPDGGLAVEDVRTGASEGLPREYRGGPFVVASTHAAAALPIIQAWQAVAGDQTVVHKLVSGIFLGPVARTLVGAPRIGVLLDGNEQIAFNNLNAAGIADARGANWSAASPDLLTEAAIVGPTTSDPADGVLFHNSSTPSGMPRYGYIVAMHYNTTGSTPGVVREVRSWLGRSELPHAYMQCEAIQAFENDLSGRFLTTAGLQDDGSAPASAALRVPSDPLVQLDGAFQADSGAIDSIGLAAGSAFKAGVQTLINESASPLITRIAQLTGRLDGNPLRGKVTYLAGHDYSVSLPISSNPQANGVRLFLNSLFESGCATDSFQQEDVMLTMSAPAQITSSTIIYTIEYENPGPRPVENVVLTDALPVGTTFVSATGGGTHAGGTVTWNLPPLASGASGSVSVTVSVTTDADYANAAQMQFSHLVVRTITSNTATTVRDTVPPTVTIIAGPTGETSDNTPTFEFAVDNTSTVRECRIDDGAFIPAISLFTATPPLIDGPHTFEVRVSDAVGNSATASRSFFVDTTIIQLTFGSGSLIIPMDTGSGLDDGQDDEMLRAYGLVYGLLRNNVPVHWVINPAKAANGADFMLSSDGGLAVEDVRTGASEGLPREYRGGPFVVASADAAAAMPIIQAWQAVAGDETVVHELISGTFSGVARKLVAAPRIAVLQDGNEQIAFNNLNAAGILDSTGGAWGYTSPDLLAEADIAGSTTSKDNDGVLFHTGLFAGFPRYGYITAMHYNTTAHTPEVVQEVRSWLTSSQFTHVFIQCEAIRTFENDSSGLFLTTAGLQDDGAAPPNPVVRVPSDPLVQADGAFHGDSGAVDSIGLASGSLFKTGVQTLINESTSPLTSRIVQLAGWLDGNGLYGKVTYLAGHDYSVSLPISSNPQGNGVRLFLNSLFKSSSAIDPVLFDVNLTMFAPELINGSTITYTISYFQLWPFPAENLVLTDVLPAGTTFVSATDGGTHADGIVTWTLPPMGIGVRSVSVTVNVISDGTYVNAAKMRYSHMAVRIATSNTATTVRDTTAPFVTIPSPPINPTATADVTPSFVFEVSSGGSSISIEARIDDGSWQPATSPFTVPTPLGDGQHTLYVSSVDAAGNIGGVVAHSFIVDTITSVVNIPSAPINPAVTADVTPSFVFEVSPGGSPISVEARIDDGSWQPATSPFTVPVPLADGTHTFQVRATDAAGNIGSATREFIVDTNDAPVAAADFAYVHNNSPTQLFVLANDNGGPADEDQTLELTEINGTPVIVGNTVGVAHGSIVPNADGTITYTPASVYVGNEVFTYTVCDTGTLCSSATVSLTVLPLSATTDPLLCLYDVDGVASDGRQFRLLFTQDPKNWPNYKLAVSNPGQHSYNVFFIGAPGPQELTVTIPYPFVTRGAEPVHVYGGVTVVNNTLGQPCFVPGNILAVDGWQLTLANYDSNNDRITDLTSYSMSFEVMVPTSGFLCLSIDLGYGLKGAGPYGKGSLTSVNDAVIPGTTTVVIPDGASYIFSVDGGLEDDAIIQSVNAFKRQPGFGGLVSMDNACGGNPVPGRKVKILGSTGAPIGTTTTDDDGWYYYPYRHKAKAATYTINLLKADAITVDQTQTVTIKANGYAQVDFPIACP